MESDDHDHHHQPTPTSEKHVITTSDGDEQGSSQVSPRSYECNFCKRGFSNAQALGGHMNIHRKDKAKLKQQSQQQPLDIHHHNKVPPILEGKSNEERTNDDPNWPYWNVSQISREESLVVHMRQLPLFAESPDTQTQPEGQRGDFPSGHHGSSSSELDLELRLGPEPHDQSSSTGTRKFL